ncbi:hypothetical protein [Erythrobacter rubeus]|uniref:DUF3494 domain-containing protein n=1 Tax=Erythrobacter rubeus TaxID=2760803 RepID=A0ABR8KPM8_9SPHN|nr:hypothetical protein [Erythrobacter rubeus]MBD2841138.1 hypothetical protein [Erythrobacter rubeus]
MKKIQHTLVLGASIIALSGCGADEIVSPGTSGDIIINNPTPTPGPTPTPPPASGVTPAAGCPTINTAGGLTDAGTISGPTGEYRVCQLPNTFDVDDNLPFVNGLLYEIVGRVNVGTDQGFNSTGTDVTVSIEPGAILFAQGESFFVVNRGNAIEANGTATMPIVWTSRDNVLGVANDNSQAQWGGVVLLGRAPVSDCSDLTFNTPGNPTANSQCEQQLEGTVVATPFGGTDSADSSGSITFNQIRFSGFELQQANELQSLTTGGTGSGTVIENLQSFNSSDDGLEFFGGSVNARNIAVIGASDDSLDVDSGAQANLETVVVVQRTGTGDSLIEFDSPDDLADGTPGNALPQSTLQVNNFTFVQRSSSSGQAVRARGGAALGLTNGVIDIDTDDDVCIRIDEQITLDAIIGFDSIVCDGVTRPVRGDAGVSDPEVQAEVDAGTNNDLTFMLSLTNTFVNGANENGHPVFDATARSSFFTTSTFIGAEDDNVADNFGDWTCNSSIMDFGSATGACTSLPVY